MKLRAARLCVAAEAERVARDQIMTIGAAIPDQPGELLASRREISSTERLTIRGVTPLRPAISLRAKPWLCSTAMWRSRSGRRSGIATLRSSISAYSSTRIRTSSAGPSEGASAGGSSTSTSRLSRSRMSREVVVVVLRSHT